MHVDYANEWIYSGQQVNNVYTEAQQAVDYRKVYRQQPRIALRLEEKPCLMGELVNIGVEDGQGVQGVGACKCGDFRVIVNTGHTLLSL